MEKTLWDVFRGREKDYINPFFWQYGGEDSLIREEMERIFDAGIRQVCVESRTHSDFLGPGWWEDMDIILEEARKREMKVWVLDDAHFPSGYANGQVALNPAYGKRYLACFHIDVRGPLTGNGFLVHLEEGETLIGVTAGKKGRKPQTLSMVHEITDKVRNGVLYWEVPEGIWTITILKITNRSTGRKGYINVIDKEAVSFFIRTIYEPHYERYGELFGKEFAGFFSDEPELGNVLSEYGHNARLGIAGQTLSWCEELGNILRQKWGDSMAVRLTALWDDIGAETQSARFEYMDTVTDLYGKYFSGQIGHWCRSHGVEYIGHVIEDNGCHSRLGLGTGHFFKALQGQDMSGIDVVLQQIRPGLDDCLFYHTHGKGQYDGTFFHYGLAKLGSSLAHLDVSKKGRTMCEIFGAYGWAEGLKLMKWLADHMLVNGVNYFVPHAFSMKEFPDRDCPPHFYARGNNPQFPYFSYLMTYMNRVSHLINNGVHVPCAGVFYPACAEWMGNCDGFEVVGRDLLQHQVDYEVLPGEALLRGSLGSGTFTVGTETYHTLIFPYCEYLPDYILQWCDRALEAGVRILFHKALPKYMQNHQIYQNHRLLLVSDLSAWLEKEHIGEISLTEKAPGLRYYHYRHDNGDLFLLFNESTNENVETTLFLPDAADINTFRYDAWENKLYRATQKEGALPLTLIPGEATIFFVGEIGDEIEILPEVGAWKDTEVLTGIKTALAPWKISMKAYNEAAPRETELHDLVNLSDEEHYPCFSGEVVYETSFDSNCLPKECRLFRLDFGKVYETMDVLLNGKRLGVRIAAPYTVEFTSDDVLPGTNALQIRVCNTLVHAVRDVMSATMPLEPTGLLGPVRLLAGL
jgi:hypothetical protein